MPQGGEMRDLYWNNLVSSLRDEQCVLVLGPEIPAKPASDANSSGSTSDLSFAEELTRRLALELESNNHPVTGRTLAAVAQQCEDERDIGPNSMRTLAAQFYKSAAYNPSDVHRSLASLPFKLILTTCHDTLLTRALQESGKRPLVCRYDLRGNIYDNPGFNPPKTPVEPVLYHLFGFAQEPRSLVLSENDVLDFLIHVVSLNPPLPDSLTRLLKLNVQSFLFLGFGIKQLHLRVLLKALIRAFELQNTADKLVTESLHGLSEGDLRQTVRFYQRGTRVEIENAEIRPFLAKLTSRLGATSEVVTPAPLPGPRPRVFISYAREDDALANRVCQVLQTSGFEPWLDKESLAAGDLWDQRIQAQLANTDFVLVLYTPALSRKGDSYVNKEIARARNRAQYMRGR